MSTVTSTAVPGRLRGIKDLPQRRREQGRVAFRAAGRDPRRAGRERRRQRALMKIIYGVTSADAGEMLWEGPARRRQQPGACARSRHRHGVPTLFAVRHAHRRGKRRARAAGKPALGPLAQRVRDLGRYGHCRSIRASSTIRCRSASASASRSSAAYQPEAPHHGRADVGVDTAGGAQAVRDVAPALRRGCSIHHINHKLDEIRSCARTRRCSAPDR